MYQYFAKLFSRAPLDLLQLHMEKVIGCLAKLDELLKIFHDAPMSELESLFKSVSEFEHEADLVKNDLRAGLPKRLFISMDRHLLLGILSTQDDLADIAEDIAGLLTIKPFTIPTELKTEFDLYKNKNMEAVWEVKEIVFCFDELIEAGFGGPVAEKIRTKIKLTSLKEHESDLISRGLKKHLFNLTPIPSTPDFYLLMQLIDAVGAISHTAEKLALRIGMLLDVT